jgi:hypothetical protein
MEDHSRLLRSVYAAWGSMKQRCYNKNELGYQNYGGRGITVCERWRNSFQAFLDDMGIKPSMAHSIDRIDNDGNYEPGNCRWSERTEQNNNKRPSWQKRQRLTDGTFAASERKPIARSRRTTFDPSTLIGQQFHQLTVLAYAGIRMTGGHQFECVCTCGEVKTFRLDHLRRAKNPVISCGCYRKAHSPAFKHGESKKPEYRTWSHMLERCSNPNCRDYKDYGERGVIVCERWKGKQGFAAFLADVGRKPSAKHSIDRIDVNGNYEPANCRWATPTEQGRNKRDNRRITFKGKTKILTEWAETFGITAPQLSCRLARGWDMDKASSLVFQKKLLLDYSVFEYNGEQRLLIDLVKQSGLGQKLVRKRLWQGWPITRAIETPVDGDNPKGETHHAAKATEDVVRQIRKMKSEHATYAEIKKETGLSISAAHAIVTGKTWTHVV